MSFNDRDDDVIKILNLREGESHFFNMFQGGGAEVERSERGLELFEIPMYGGNPSFEQMINEDDIITAVNKVYDEWI